MTLKPWREVITPHEDVLHGTFQQSEFAADLTKVVRGIATPEYQDPVRFFERTVITEGMGRLLETVLQRLSGDGGDPVVQLQTFFGGGKTHTMLAVYHVVCGQAPAGDLQGVPPLLDRTGVAALPTGRVAVLDGNDLAPAQPRTVDGLKLHTLWGELAYQLGGLEGYDIVRASDEQGTSPGKDVLMRLFDSHAPCVVLIDEATAYLRQFEPGTSYAGGTFDSVLSFIQALTEAATAADRTMVLGSLPESNLEVGGQRGQQALQSLEKYFGRVESVWKPVGATEAFEIVRRRLFKSVQNDTARDAVCQAFADYYLAHKQDFPSETLEATYLHRLRQTYPIHPEVFTRLYEDWSTLPKFHHTRGVLRLMARLIHRLWSDGNYDLMIMPGAFPLYDGDVRIELIKYLEAGGWDAIVERDVDGENSTPRRLDDETPALGQVQACRRAARTIFLGSAPSSSAQKVRGVGIERVRLGCAQPSQSPGRYTDAVRRLDDKLHYLYSGNDRYWYDTRPNLRREMEDRVQRFDRPETFFPEIRKRLEGLLPKGKLFGGVHVFRDDADVPDDAHLRLVVLPPDHPHRRREKDSRAVQLAARYLKHRGSQPRLGQNRQLFLTADAYAYAQLRLHTRAFLAWESIVKDAQQLNLDPFHQRQATSSRDTAEGRMKEALLQTYCWLLAPRQELSGKGDLLPLAWEEAHVERGGQRFIENLWQAALDAEMVIPRWAPVHLKAVLDQFYIRQDNPEISTKKLWDDITRYTYLPRLKNQSVLIATIEAGIQHEDFFGLASGKDEDKYTGLVFGKPSSAYLAEGELLLAPEVARQHLPRPEPISATGPTGPVVTETAPGFGETSGDGSGTKGGKPTTTTAQKTTRFYGATTLDAINAKGQFSEVMDEVVQHFTATYGTKVTIRVDIEAEDPNGFTDQVQSTVRVNCDVLGFTNAEFEEE